MNNYLSRVNTILLQTILQSIQYYRIIVIVKLIIVLQTILEYFIIVVELLLL